MAFSASGNNVCGSTCWAHTRKKQKVRHTHLHTSRAHACRRLLVFQHATFSAPIHTSTVATILAQKQDCNDVQKYQHNGNVHDGGVVGSVEIREHVKGNVVDFELGLQLLEQLVNRGWDGQEATEFCQMPARQEWQVGYDIEGRKAVHK